MFLFLLTVVAVVAVAVVLSTLATRRGWEGPFGLALAYWIAEFSVIVAVVATLLIVLASTLRRGSGQSLPGRSAVWLYLISFLFLPLVHLLSYAAMRVGARAHVALKDPCRTSFWDAGREGYEHYLQGFAVQRDGGIAVVGNVESRDVYDRWRKHKLGRLAPNGVVDQAFAANARCLEAPGSLSVRADGTIVLLNDGIRGEGLPAAIFFDPGGQPAGRVPQPRGRSGAIAGGFRDDGGLILGGEIGLLRLRPDGSIDPEFGVDGAGGVEPQPVARDTRGRVIALDVRSARPHVDPGVRLVAFDQQGRLDEPFRASVEETARTHRLGTAVGVVLLPDDRLLVTFDSAETPGSSPSLRLLHPDGTPDTSFEAEPFAGARSTLAFHVARAGDGRILIAGHVDYPDAPFLTRLSREGRTDVLFRENAAAALALANVALVLQVGPLADGSIVVGFARRGSPAGAMHLLKLLPDGRRDESFQPPPEFR